MIFAAELIQELQKEFPHLRIPAITDTDDLAGLLLFITEVPNLLTDPQPWRAGIFLSVLFLFLLLAKGKHVGVFGFQRLDASAQGCYLLEGLVVQGLCDCLTLLCLELRVFGIARALQG
jgi:hypothetical protein